MALRCAIKGAQEASKSCSFIEPFPVIRLFAPPRCEGVSLGRCVLRGVEKRTVNSLANMTDYALSFAV